MEHLNALPAGTRIAEYELVEVLGAGRGAEPGVSIRGESQPQEPWLGTPTTVAIRRTRWGKSRPMSWGYTI